MSFCSPSEQLPFLQEQSLTPLSRTPVAPHFLGEGFFRVYWNTSLPPAITGGVPESEGLLPTLTHA